MTPEEHAQQLAALLPPGDLWAALTDAGTDWSALLGALAEEPARLDTRVADLYRELDPRTVDELLSEWEAWAGLPGACTPDLNAPALRRLLLRAVLTGAGYPAETDDTRSDQHASVYETLAAALGHQAKTEERRPFAAGASAAGQALHNGEWVYRWLVRSDQPTSRDPFAAGTGAAGDPVSRWGDARLQCLVRERAPAHTIVDFAYAGEV